MVNLQVPCDPQQNLFSDESTLWIYTQLHTSALRCLEEGWQGVFRRSALKSLPAQLIAQNFSPDHGRPTKEIYSMIGLVLIAEFKGWTADEAALAYSVDAGVQYALNITRDSQFVSPRCVEDYRRLLREGDDLCSEIFGAVTKELVDELHLNITKQRLDSTHVYSNMARLGRAKLMATSIKRFLTQVLRHDPEAHAALPAELLARYAPAESRLFGFGKASDEEKSQRLQQLAEDLHYLITHFQDTPTICNRTSYKAITRIFQDQCEVAEAAPTKGKGKANAPKVSVKEKSSDPNGKSSNVMQNTSDPEAGYDGHKGEGYQVQLSQTCDPENEVNLIVGCLPQSAAMSDAESIIPLLESQADYDLTPLTTLADTAYGSDENVQQLKASGIALISPVPGKAPQPIPAEATPKPPLKDSEAAQAAERNQARRAAQETDEWKKQYAKRSGIEGVNRALDRVTGMKELVVRGIKSVSMAILLKVTGWNINQAARSYARSGIKARKMSRLSLQAA